MTAPSFTYSGNVYTGAAAGTVDFALTSTTGNAIAYLEPSHIHVYKSSNQGSTWTELTRPSQWDFVTNGTVARLVTGIAAGDWVKVQRITPSTSSYVTFQASSLLTADQLNDDTLFNTYLNQERVDQSDQSTLTANTASTNAATAVSTANTALSTANAASASAASAVSTANTASTNATAAVATANTASTNASAAVATSNTASSNASAAVSTANTAASNASTALSTANTALTNANAAVTTSNNANTTAQAANTTATNAESIANSALSIVAGTVQFVPVANVAAIPASPSNDDAIQIQDSTGIQSFTPLTGLPSGFVGTPQLFVRLQYDTPGSTWQYVGYGANDPDNRYVIQGVTGTANNPSFYFDPDTGIYSPGANELGLSTGGAARLTIDSAGAVAIPGSLSVAGQAAVVTNDARLSDTRTPTDNTVSTAKIVDGAVTSAKIADGAIVDADVNASAAIAGTKISPDFGAQNVTTTGASTAASFIPTSSTVPTNGVYLPAANSVAISTNGVGRLLVDADGRLCVGGASTLGTVVVSTAGGAPVNLGVFRETVNGADFRISSPATASQYISGSALGDTVLRAAANNLIIGVSDATKNITFGTPSSERMRLDSSGRLGIGTSSVNGLLHLATAETRAILLNNSSIGTAAGDGTYISNKTDGSFAIINQENNSFTLGTNNTDRLTITGGGLVGIGTTSANVRLHVNVDSASETDVARFQASNGADVQFLDIGVDPTGNLVSYDATGSTGGAHVFRRGGSEVMRLDDSSRLLVGTSSAIDNTAGTVLQLMQGDKPASIALGRNDGNITAGKELGNIKFYGTEQGYFPQTLSAQIGGHADGSWTDTSAPSRLVFSTCPDGSASPVERLRITNNGFLKISNDNSYTGIDTNTHGVRQGTGANWTWMTVNDTVDPFGIRVRYLGAAPNGTGNPFVSCADTAGARFEVRSNGGIANYSGNNVNLSDINSKKDISPAAGTWDCIKEWEIVNYRYKDQPDDADLNLGVIAQQVAESCPEVITVFEEAKDDQPEKLGVKEQQMYWMAIKALQEAQVRIETLEAEVAALKAQ